MDVTTVAAKLEEFIRPTTFPVAVRFLRAGEAPPEKAKRPVEDLHKHVTVCQGWGIARKYGWTTVLRADDMKCPLERSSPALRRLTHIMKKATSAQGCTPRMKLPVRAARRRSRSSSRARSTQ